MSFDIEDIRIGDILVEIGLCGEREAEVARYLIYGKFVDTDDYEVRAMREVTYFKTYLLYIGKEYDNHWARSNNPGNTYYLSEHEISNYHAWERIFKSPLPALMSEERRIPREG